MTDRYDVYLHDTPQKTLFQSATRMMSHGCVRVENPRALAAMLLGQSPEAIDKAIAAGSTTRRPLPTPLPIFIVYQTAFVDESGKLTIREDLYGRDSRVIAALKGDERRFADVAVERPQTGARQQAVRLPPRQFPFGGGGQFPFFGWFR